MRSARGRKAKWTTLDISSPVCTGEQAANPERPKVQPAYVCLQISYDNILAMCC